MIFYITDTHIVFIIVSTKFRQKYRWRDSNPQFQSDKEF